MTKSDFESVLYSKAKEADLDGRHNSDINTKPLATPILETAKASKKKLSDDDGEEEDSSSSDSEDENITPLDEEKLKAALAMEGMDAKIKELYLGKEGVDGEEHEWVDRMPMAMQMKASAMSAKERERAKFAVLVRMELRPKSRFTDDNPMQIHSIVVQSPLLRRVLQRVFESHPGVNSAESKLTFEKPLAPFVHRWRQFVQAAKEEEDPETKGHLNLLMDAVKPEIEATIMTKILCIENDSITFDKLWLIFEPGTLVVSASDKADCAYKLIRYSIRKNDRGCWFVMECVYTDWDGEIFGKAKEILAVAIFEGACKLSELDVIPLEIHKDKTTIVENLLKRGKRFKELAGMKNMVFRGTAIDRSEDPPKKIFVDGRIMIDAGGYIQYNPNADVSISPFKAEATSYYDYGSTWGGPTARSSKREKRIASDQEELSEEQMLACRHLVRGFSLKLKTWLDFQIEGVTDISWNDRAFERLILPGDHKKLLLAFAVGQRDCNDEFDDIIEGKGKGMIIQLNGPPGVGKTLTAEAVAETMRVPLYTISAGDLGLRPEEVQYRLSSAFQLARRWSAVLLLDEADIFMERRSTKDLERNQLVSIFLQSLEFYQGTLFLTTNRVETFDEAFESRVHIAIKYDELSAASRREVWKTFLGVQARQGQLPNEGQKSVGEREADITEEDIEDFVKEGLNGRQIKNVVKSADLLARSDKGPLRAEHVRVVLRIKKMEKDGRWATKT